MRRALLVCVVLAAVAAPSARADVVATIPDGTWIDSVAVTPTGAVWVSGAGAGPGRSRVGQVTPAGIAWQEVPIAAVPGLAGRVLPRPDGGIWAVLRQQFALRSTAGGSLVRSQNVARAVTVQTDGALWTFPSPTEVQRIGLDGRSTTRTIRPPGPPAGVREDLLCGPDDATVVLGGNMWVADSNCARIVQLRADGTVIQGLSLPAETAGRWLGIEQLAGASDGAVWALPDQASSSTGVRIVGGEHTPVTLPFFADPGPLVAAPDGSAWAADRNACSILHLTAAGTEVLRTPFAVQSVAPAADGTVWLAGWSKLAHVAPATLPRLDAEALEQPGPCGGYGPKGRLRDVRDHAIRLAVLRRDGLRISSARPGTAIGSLKVAGLTTSVQVAVGPKGGAIKLSDRILDRLAARLRRGDRAVVDAGLISVYGRNGQGGDQLPRKIRVTR